jgi:hypothetical protein
MVAEQVQTPAATGRAGLFKAMAAVLGEVDRVPKSGENSFFHYKYATEADLMDMLRPILAKHGLALFISVDGVETRAGGTQGDIARVGLDITIGCADGGESITTRWYGEGQDKADKALYKAYTGAVKYFCFKTFLVSTGDDPEDERTAQSASGGSAQAQRSASGGPPSASGGSVPLRGPAAPVQAASSNGVAALPTSAPTPPRLVQTADGAWTLLIDGQQYRVPDSFKDLTAAHLEAYKGWVRKARDARGLPELVKAWSECEQPAAAIGEQVRVQVKAVFSARKLVLQNPPKPRVAPAPAQRQDEPPREGPDD